MQLKPKLHMELVGEMKIYQSFFTLPNTIPKSHIGHQFIIWESSLFFIAYSLYEVGFSNSLGSNLCTSYLKIRLL